MDCHGDKSPRNDGVVVELPCVMTVNGGAMAITEITFYS